MTKHTTIILGLSVLGSLAGCGESGDSQELPSSAPTKVEPVAQEGFTDAGAVAASPDGSTFYVAAHTDDQQPAIFAVDASDGSMEALHIGAPLLYPSDLAASCDGDRVLVSDMGIGIEAGPTDFDFADIEGDGSEQRGSIHVLASDGSSIGSLQASGIGRAAGLVLSVDCETLYVSGFTEAGIPAVFTVPQDGGAAKVLHEGAPLRSPTGIHVDADNVAWVMDHAARSEGGEGMLFAIDPEGNISEVAAGLAMGRHGGVSLAPGGVTAVIPVDDPFNGPQLITANTQTGQTATMPLSDIQSPAGVASARNAPVMVVAGADSIHIATFDE